MSIARSSYQSTVDLAYPDEDVNLLGHKIDKMSTKPWSVQNRKPLAILSFMFVVYFGYNAGTFYEACASMTKLTSTRKVTVNVFYDTGTPVENANVYCYDSDNNSDDDYLGTDITNANGVAVVGYADKTWDTYWIGKPPDIYCHVAGANSDTDSPIKTDVDEDIEVTIRLDQSPGIIKVTVVRADNTPARNKHIECYDKDKGYSDSNSNTVDKLFKVGTTDQTGEAKMEYYKKQWFGLDRYPMKRDIPDIYCKVGNDRSEVLENFAGDEADLGIKLSY
jgi:hypothetical protein